jgi:ubiquitin-protein ligase
MSAIKKIIHEYKQYLNDPSSFYTIEQDPNNIYIWKIYLFGPLDTIFEGGIFECQLIFPKKYPNAPPEFKFITNLFHPNIYKDGKMCISILHNGNQINDDFTLLYEHISERWNPSHSVNSILMSILTIIDNPNFESSANIDATNLWQKNWDEYKKIIYKTVSLTQK